MLETLFVDTSAITAARARMEATGARIQERDERYRTGGKRFIERMERLAENILTKGKWNAKGRNHHRRDWTRRVDSWRY